MPTYTPASEVAQRRSAYATSRSVGTAEASTHASGHKAEVEASIARILSDAELEVLFTSACNALEIAHPHVWILLLKFPCRACTDRGIAINNPDYWEEWHLTLQGEAACVYEHFVMHLKPLGFKLRAQVTEYDGDGCPLYAEMHFYAPA